MLEVRNLSCRYGSLYAVNNVSLSVPLGDRCVLVGPNGAGKSTLFGLIAGTIRPTAGSVWLNERDITKVPDYKRAAMGIGRAFQTARLFDEISALDNVELAVDRSRSTKVARRNRVHRGRTEAARLLTLVGLGGREHTTAGELSHGERRSLELALALGTGADTLLLDEPTSGMSDVETAEFVSMIRGLDRTLTTVVVEHNLDVAFEIASTVCILDSGRLVFKGTAAETASSNELRSAYLREEAIDDDAG